MKKPIVFLVSIIGLLILVNLVSALNTVRVSFWRQAHPQPNQPELTLTLFCDGVAHSQVVPPPQSLTPATYEYLFNVDCVEMVLQFDGRVYSGLGQKIDNVSLTVNDGPNLVQNGTFDTGLQLWSNPDIGIDGQNGGWTWAKGRKQQAKLDGEGAGSNAVWGETYRLSQDIVTP